MPSKTLEKALKGDDSALILLAEKIDQNQLAIDDLAAIKASPNTPNRYQDYLLACIYTKEALANNRENSQLLITAKDLILPWATRGDRYAKSLLSVIEEELGYTKQAEKYLKEAVNAGDKLALLRYVNKLLVEWNTWVSRSDEKIKEIRGMLPYLAAVYKTIPPGLQLEAKRLVKLSEQLNHNAEQWYQTSLHYENMGLKYDMYRCVHEAISLDDGNKYIKKLIKAMERLINKDTFFETKIDSKYLDGYVDFLQANLKKMDTEINQLKEPTEIKKQLDDIALSVNNISHIMKFKVADFEPVKFDKFLEKFNILLESTRSLSEKIKNIKPDGPY